MKTAFQSLALFLGFISTSAFADASKMESLKTQIISIALENQENLENFKEVRAQLEPLVNELASLQSLSAEESLERKIGSWQQLWTDDADDVRANNLFVSVDRKQTYQVVFANGSFYNVSVINLPLGLRFTAFLKGLYESAGKILGLEFVSLKLRLGGIKQLEETVIRADAGKLIGLVGFPGGAKKPNGPIGVKGEIETIYIDEQLRIDIGQNLDDGVKDLFVLVRNAN